MWGGSFRTRPRIWEVRSSVPVVGSFNTIYSEDVPRNGLTFQLESIYSEKGAWSREYGRDGLSLVFDL